MVDVLESPPAPAPKDGVVKRIEQKLKGGLFSILKRGKPPNSQDASSVSFLKHDPGDTYNDGLTKKQIKSFVEEIKNSDSDLQYSKGRELERKYVAMRHGRIAAKKLDEVFQKEDAFLSNVRWLWRRTSIRDDLTIDNRVIGSDLVALYGLLVNGDLDRFYEAYEEKVKREGKPPLSHEDEVLSAKVDIANAYLQWNREKNNERTAAENIRKPITVGIEIEYSTPLRDIFIGLADSPNFIQVVKNAALATRMVGKDIVTYDYVGLARSALNDYDRVADAAQLMGVGVSKTDAGNSKEYVTQPSASPRTILREIAQIAKAGGFGGKEWGIHENIGGITLNPEHTEVMDLTALSYAAGFMGDKTISNKNEKQIMNDEVPLMENYGKVSDNRGSTPRSHYFPFHKAKRGFGVVNYPSIPKDLVEFRSSPPVNREDFSLLVRDLTFKYLGAWGVRAVQTLQPLQTDSDKALVGTWEELMHGWNNLLRTKNIVNPPNSARVKIIRSGNSVLGPMDFVNKGITPYERFLMKLLYLSKYDDNFRTKARALITAYNSKVRPIVDYTRPFAQQSTPAQEEELAA